MSKKSRKQRERKRAKVGEKAPNSELLLKKQKTNEARTQSLTYLDSWAEHKENKSSPKVVDESNPGWKFQKSKQVWLLKNMYHLEKLPAKHFKVMVNYIETMQGESKTRVIAEAKTYL